MVGDNMNYFLVMVNYSVSNYEQQDKRLHTNTHLVVALDKDEAEEKAKKHYERLTVPYDIYYMVMNVTAMDTII
jgi:hypothetical protein